MNATQKCYGMLTKKGLASTNPIQMPQHLQDLTAAVDDLDLLHAPFSKEEIDNAVKCLPSDVFNNDFIKKCWPNIAPDFYALCEAFQAGDICLQSINGSYITLLPKVDSPAGTTDLFHS